MPQAHHQTTQKAVKIRAFSLPSSCRRNKSSLYKPAMTFPTEIFKTGHHELGGVPHGAESFVLAQALQAVSGDILYIASGDREMDSVRAGREFFARGPE